MNKKQIEKRINFFNVLNGLSKKDKFLYIKDCPDRIIDIICEACHNLLKLKSLKDQTKVRNKVRLIGNAFKQLSSPETSIATKRDLLKEEEIGVVVFSLLSSTVLPNLIKLRER